ncbi:hypothetical protein K474DRAFT_1488264 [Panus rudis PR-1116 ss-1]|nr:hypothetical protein K474DRAFT_1488264 [Panus rudis PR-1116 ss-1]
MTNGNRPSDDLDEYRHKPMNSQDPYIMDPQDLIAAIEQNEGLPLSPPLDSPASLPPPPRASNKMPRTPRTTPMPPSLLYAYSPKHIASFPSSPECQFIDVISPGLSRVPEDAAEDGSPLHAATAPNSPTPSLSHSSDSSHVQAKSIASLPSSPEAQQEFSSIFRPSRHRYLASFSKVERFLGKGILLGRRSESVAIVATTPAAVVSDRARPDMRQMDSPAHIVSTQVMDERTLLCFVQDVLITVFLFRVLGPAGRVSEECRSSGGATVAKGVTETLPNVLPLSRPAQHEDSHGCAEPTAMSPRSRSSESRSTSESSHEPPSTASAEGRISISSTIYPATSSTHSIHSHFYPGRSSMHSDRDSFIDLASPTFSSPRSPQFHNFDAPREPDSRYSTSPNRSNDTTKHTTSAENKPPIPTAPKPNFGKRTRTAQSSSRRPEPLDIPPNSSSRARLPSTTNTLNAKERADRVRKTQKLTQVFGQTPGAGVLGQGAADPHAPSSFLSAGPLGSKRKHHRAAVSVSGDVLSTEQTSSKRAIWPPPEGTTYMRLGSRRHSSPLTPRQFTFDDDVLSIEGSASSEGGRRILIGSEEGVPHDDWDGGHPAGRRSNDRGSVRSNVGSPTASVGSPTSFMDLSDEEAGQDGASSIISLETPKVHRRAQPFSPSTPSLLESLSPEEQQEEDRRRKREKVAKLHRFLGSRVPTDLVLAQIDTAVPRPAAAPVSAIHPLKSDTDDRKAKMRRRRSSSAAELPGTWSDDIDRLKEDLNDREKAINVRRAVKMEKMFGVAPPQTLYHTRQAGAAAGSPSSQPLPPRLPTPPQSPISPRNLNNSAYSKKGKKTQRPGTADSETPLISRHLDEGSFAHALSDVYLHYRHSLNSLNDIIDREDKESLVDLHEYLHTSTSNQQLQTFTRQDGSPPLTSPSIKSERRRSLPSRTSMTSLSSEISLMTVTSPEPTEFQARRRRAAKLTQFFGVDYRELMSEIFDSLEKGLEEESGRGTLKPDEAQLLNRLRRLRVKRASFI